MYEFADDIEDIFVFGTDDRDEVIVDRPKVLVSLRLGDDTLTTEATVGLIVTGMGDDEVELGADAAYVGLGPGDDRLTIGGGVVPGSAIGGEGTDTLAFEAEAGAYDIEIAGTSVRFIDRFSGDATRALGFESFEFADRTFSFTELAEAFGPAAPVPYIQVGGGTQVVTVNDPHPTVSVVWDRVIQQAVIDTDEVAVGPTVSSRAYAMMHTAMYDAWATYDPVAVRISFDAGDDNAELARRAVATDAHKAKAMSYAAVTVLQDLFPDQQGLVRTVMEDRFGYTLEDDGSLEAEIGIDAAEDLLALRRTDGSNQQGNYAGDFAPSNANPLAIADIAAWTPESVPIDPEGVEPYQEFLTPQWGQVESFALPEHANGATDHDPLRPDAPQSFFTDAFTDATLSVSEKSITLASAATIGGMAYQAGDTIPVSKDLIGEVINEAFITQAEDVVAYSADLTDRHKIIAEFWEDGGGTAFPPGTWMAFSQFESARSDHSLDDDAKLFMMMGNAVMDAGIATWDAKVYYDYVRPVRAIRELGELGLIGDLQTDPATGETVAYIEAFAGIDPETGAGLGTQTIRADAFVSFQRFTTDPSPPFAEYTSGHSAFSAAGAEVLYQFTGSDDFGASVTFAPGSTQFEAGVPAEETTLSWPTYSVAADEAGLSRLFGGIHFSEGDLNGRALGREVGAAVYDTAAAFIDGTATDEDRPFFFDDFLF